jgi:hypothetical protein
MLPSKLTAVLFIFVLLTGCRSTASDDAATLHAKPGFVTIEEDGRLWVLRPGEKPSEKHITLVGAGPGGMTIKALEKDTALAYIATAPGFNVEIEEGRIWVLRPGEEKSEKHITLVGAGPMGMTIKALNKETAQEYIACLGSDET